MRSDGRGELKVPMKILLRVAASSLLMLPLLSSVASAQNAPWMPDVTQKQTYALHRASSKEATGGNTDYRTVNPGETLALLEADGPGMISHLWFTINDSEPYHLKRIVLRIYWDGEETPSVETPIGDFFGLGLGIYYNWQSALLSVGSSKALNCFFPMPYRKHARI